MRDNISTNEIRDIIVETERAEIAATDASLEPLSREAVLREFITLRARQIVELLGELREWRTSSSSAQGGENIFEKQGRIIVEGFSDESGAAALSDALNKASHYFSEMQDVSLTLKQLNELKGGGHRAVLELHLTPLSLRDHAHIKGLDVETKQFKEREFHKQIKQEEGEARHLVFDHFVEKIGAAASTIPDYLLINVNDALLMNYMIEKDFFRAGKKNSFLNPDEKPHPSQIRVRKIESDQFPEPD